MKSIWILLLSPSLVHAGLNTLPQDVSDPATSYDLSFIYQKVIKNSSDNCSPGQTIVAGGSCSTVGDVSQAGNNAFTGTNSFASTTTVGNTSIYSTTANYADIVYGGCATVAVSSFTAATSVVLSNIVSSYTYVLDFNITQNTSNAELRSRMDSDTTAGNYRSVVIDNNSAGGSGSDTDGGAAGYMKMTGGTDIVLAGAEINGRCDIKAGPLTRTRFYWNCTRSYFNQASVFDGGNNWGRYTGSGADPHTLTLLDSAGTMTGYVTLMSCNQKAAY